ncbi:hypothetical protein V8B97DRAFT_2026921 [Scleroderma yunnanense]
MKHPIHIAELINFFIYIISYVINQINTKAQSHITVRTWAINKGGLTVYVESSDENIAMVVVAPHQCPYNITKHSGHTMEFCPILLSSGAKIGYVCNRQQFVYGLLRLTLLVHTLELIKIPHPDDIKYHTISSLNCPFVKQTLHIFSAQFCLQELWRVFSLGDKVKVIADPFCGETGYVVAVHKVTIVMTVMQENRTSDNVKVSKLLIQSYLQEHMWSHSTEHEHANLPLPLLSKDEEEGVLPGDVAQVCCGPYTGKRGTIEWITPDAPHTLFLSKDKGYNVVVGDIMEVARGKWYHCQGVVNMVDLT